MASHSELADKLGVRKGELEKQLKSLTGEFKDRERKSIQDKIDKINSFMEGELQRDQEISKAENLKRDLLKAKTPEDQERIKKEYGLGKMFAEQTPQFKKGGDIDKLPIENTPMVPFDNSDNYRNYWDYSNEGDGSNYKNAPSNPPIDDKAYYTRAYPHYANNLYKTADQNYIPVENYPDDSYRTAPDNSNIMAPSGGGYEQPPGNENRFNFRSLGQGLQGMLNPENMPNLVNAASQFQKIDYIQPQYNPANQAVRASMQEQIDKARQAREALTMSRYIDPAQRLKEADSMYDREVKSSQNLTGQERALYQGAVNAQRLDAKNRIASQVATENQKLAAEDQIRKAQGIQGEGAVAARNAELFNRMGMQDQNEYWRTLQYNAQLDVNRQQGLNTLAEGMSTVARGKRQDQLLESALRTGSLYGTYTPEGWVLPGESKKNNKT